MNEGAPRYRYTARARPGIAALAAAAAAGPMRAARFAGDPPFVVELVIWLIAVLALLAAMGALISVSAEVGGAGNFSLAKTLAGIPITRMRIRADDVVRDVRASGCTPAAAPQSVGASRSDTRIRCRS